MRNTANYESIFATFEKPSKRDQIKVITRLKSNIMDTLQFSIKIAWRKNLNWKYLTIDNIKTITKQHSPLTPHDYHQRRPEHNSVGSTLFWEQDFFIKIIF